MVLPAPLGADQAGDLGAADGHVELVDGGEAAEVDAQVLGLQDGALVHVPLWNLVDAGHRNQLGLGSLYAAHCLPPPFTAAAWGASARSRWNSREKKPFRGGIVGGQHDQDQHNGVHQHAVVGELAQGLGQDSEGGGGE